MFSKTKYFRLRDTILYIGIEEKLYTNKKIIFDSIMKAFVLEKSCNSKYKCMYVFFYDTFYNRFTNTFYCNPDKEWVYQCIAAIEEYIISNLEITAFHAASVIYQGNTLIFFGERFSGKSTLTNYMMTKNNCFLLDDDIVFWNSLNNVMGLGMPLRMRDPPKKGKILCEFLDENNTTRYLTDTFRYSMYSTNKIYPFFLKYNTFEEGIEYARGSILFESLLKSVRFSKNNMTAFNEICNIMHNFQIYTLKYKSSSRACDLINQVLGI